MKHQITLNDVIHGRYYESCEEHIMTQDEKDKYIDMFRSFLLSTCRSGRLYDRIRYATFSTLNTCGIFDRLVIDGERAKYIAGQDYSSEIRYVKQLIAR